MKTVLISSTCLLLAVFSISGCSQRPENPAAECRIDAGACIKKMRAEDLTVSLDIRPKPVKTMSELVFSVSLSKGGAPVTGADVALNLTMPGMYMAANKTALQHKGGGKYEGKGVIVRCPSGRKRWKAEVLINKNGAGQGPEIKTDYVFEVRE